MAYTLAELRTLALQRADMEGSAFVGTAELNRYINDSVKELFELLVVTYGQEYFYALGVSTTSTDVASYAMPSSAFKLLRVDVKTQYGYEPLHPWKFPASLLGMPTPTTLRRPGRLPRYRWTGANITFEPAPDNVHEFRVHYVPRPARLVADTDELGRPLDDWVEYVVLGAAIKCLTKEESDASTLLAERNALRQHIAMTAPPKDAGYAQTVVDDRCHGDDDPCCDPGGWTAALFSPIQALFEQPEDEELDLAKIQAVAVQSIPDDTDTTVILGVAAFQKGTTVIAQPSTNNIQVTVSGYYEVTWAGNWNFDADGWRQLNVLKNGADFANDAVLLFPSSATNTSIVLSKTGLFQFAAGDVLSLKARQNSGAGLNLLAFLSVTKFATT